MKRGLFLKYVTLFVGLVAAVLVINSALDLYFVYQENRRASIEVQREKADAAAQKIESFVREIERQIGWVAYAQFDSLPAEQRRFDYVRLLRQVPAITELAQLDRTGHEQLHVSRLSMDVMGSNLDRSTDPAFIEAKANKVYFGPVSFRKGSEPYLTMAVAHGGRGGVTVADINLKLIWDVISQIKIGQNGYAYVVDRQGRLVAHPDISLVLRGTDMSRLAQVEEALKAQGGDEAPVDARNRNGVSVLSAHAAIPALNWLVFVELPTAEAQQPVIDYGLRDVALLVLGLLIAGTVAALLARRMVVPIRAMQEGAQRIGGGDLGHRLDIRTGDELEALADQFNRSAEALQESYETLEQRVEDRTKELSESLEQQTATAGILQVISSSPTDTQPVFEAIAESALKLLNGWGVIVWRYDGERLHMEARRSSSADADESVLLTLDGARPEDFPYVGDVIRNRAIGIIHDSEDAGVAPVMRDIARGRGWRANVAVPMLKDGQPIGVITVSRRNPGPFAEREIRLLETFADQAVIAVQNVRLFTELRESLEQQTATTEILQVISQSPTDVEPVLKAVAKAAVRFCGAGDAVIALRDGSSWYAAAHEGPLEALASNDRLPLDRETSPGRAIIDNATVHLPDVARLDPVEFAATHRMAARMGFQAALAAPMLREGVAIGAIALRRPQAGAFSARQIELLESFAAQAVIAIENVRLFTELRESLEQQTATADILHVISQSPTDVQPVLDAVARAALRFCGAQDALIAMRDGEDNVFTRAHEGNLESTTLGLRQSGLARHTALGQSILDGRTVHLPDISALDSQETKALWNRNNVKAAVAAPMLREGVAIGGILLRKSEAGPFTARQIGLLEAFAAQAVIAIENVRLFTEIQEKSRQLEVASQHKSQFLANMSHELRTPLNAILGYTEMMVDGLYGDVPAKAQGVLERVQANGKHLLGLINDVLDLSKIEAGQLTLAVEEYSVGDMVSTVMSATESLARTKNIALVSAVPPGLPRGMGDARRLTQVLLNLVGNAIKFTDQGKVEIRARQQGDRFKISVIDTGPGIAAADQAKIFEEFQQVDNTSTRKKGGTGLGLSISRKIVELHGGRINVESDVGKGSNFKITIPIHVVSIKDAAQ